MRTFCALQILVQESNKGRYADKYKYTLDDVDEVKNITLSNNTNPCEGTETDSVPKSEFLTENGAVGVDLLATIDYTNELVFHALREGQMVLMIYNV